MKPAATIPRAIFFLLLASLLACNDNNEEKSYQQNYHPQPAVVFANAPGTLKYNPKHGEPGHRHDIPDGAPLSGAPALPASTLANFSKENSQAQMGNPSLLPSGSVTSSLAGALNPAHGQPGHRCDIAVGDSLGSIPATTSVNTALPAQKLNPAHGEPGHRCDIAVGAPLNSIPERKTVSNTVGTPTTSTASPKLNPSHGQPGHRCDIAVGAPLNSPASIPASTTNTSAVPLPTLTTSPAKSDSAQVPLIRDSSGNLIRLNPAHGQPGHDCSIAVGKPLKQ